MQLEKLTEIDSLQAQAIAEDRARKLDANYHFLIESLQNLREKVLRTEDELDRVKMQREKQWDKSLLMRKLNSK
jgi:hypothetical protein